jgi:uncharacterized protein YcnI
MPLRLVLPLAALAALVVAAGASAHARVSPSVAIAGESDLYSLVVPTEKEDAATTKVVLTVPDGFSIDSFVDAPGWKRTVQTSGSGEEAVVEKVTWEGGSTPTGEDSLFQFLGRPSDKKTYSFTVDQTYSDGSVASWAGPESSDEPAPTVEAKSSFGGGSSTVAIIALVLGGVALILGVIALVAGGGRRQLA